MFFAVAAHKKNRVFVTMPRFQEGIPVTVGVVTDKKLNNNPIISPYPSWEWHKNPASCGRNRIVSVYRVLVSQSKKIFAGFERGVFADRRVSEIVDLGHGTASRGADLPPTDPSF
jgi:hypothetical protein